MVPKMFVINEEKNFQLKHVWLQNGVSSKQGTDIILGVGWGRNWGSLNPQVVFFPSPSRSVYHSISGDLR